VEERREEIEEKQAVRALTMQTLLWSLKLFIVSNNVDLESK